MSSRGGSGVHGAETDDGLRSDDGQRRGQRDARASCRASSRRAWDAQHEIVYAAFSRARLYERGKPATECSRYSVLYSLLEKEDERRRLRPLVLKTNAGRMVTRTCNQLTAAVVRGEKNRFAARIGRCLDSVWAGKLAKTSSPSHIRARDVAAGSTSVTAHQPDCQIS